MKKSLILGLLVGCATALSASAAEDQGEKTLTPEQQETRNAIIQKYDANKDGILDKTELKKISRSDKKALAKVGGVGTSMENTKVKPAKEDAEKVKSAGEKPEKTKPAREGTEKVKPAKEKAAKNVKS
jgi:hypothetical protein